MALLHASRSVSCTQNSHSYLPSRPRRPGCAAAAHAHQPCAPLSTRALTRLPPLSLRFGSSFFNNSSLLTVKRDIREVKRGSRSTCKGRGGACAAVSSITLSGETLRWVCTCAAAALLFLKEAAINKAILVPLLALQAPRAAVSAIRGEYGLWTAFLALLVRLFYQIPGELELPLVFVLLLITVPPQVLEFRGTTAALVVSACTAAYLAYQHFSGTGGLKDSFKGGALFATIAIVLLILVPVVVFFGGY